MDKETIAPRVSPFAEAVFGAALVEVAQLEGQYAPGQHLTPAGARASADEVRAALHLAEQQRAALETATAANQAMEGRLTDAAGLCELGIHYLNVFQHAADQPTADAAWADLSRTVQELRLVLTPQRENGAEGQANG